VTDQNGETVIGASVVVKGTTNGTISGLDGDFSIPSVKKGDVIIITYVGYVSQEIVWDGKPMKVILKEDSKTLDEVVVVGYGTTSKRKTTSAVSQVKADDIAKVPVPNITQSLAGRAPGLIVTQSGGGVNAKASISIRGGGTPLYVIDNIICEERDFQNLNPEDIDQMSILKDASATAVYGARAANGIVMVTTKTGKTGKLNVDYSFNYTLSQPADLQDKVDSYTAANYVNRGLEYDGRAPQYTLEDLELFRNGKDPQGHANVDWQDITMRNFAPEMRHNLTLTGGSETMKIYTGLGYYNQESIYRTNSNNMQRYNFRTNMEATLKNIGLKVAAGVDAYIVDLNEPATASGRGYYTTWSHIQNKRPWEPAYNQFGQIYSGTTDNALVDISNEGGYYKESKSSVRGNLNLEWAVPWIEGLTLKALGSYTIANDRNKSWNKSAQTYDWEGNPATANKPSLSKETYYHRNFNTQFFADYARTFNNVHTIGATFGMEASGQDYDNSGLSRKEYIFDVDQIGSGPVETMENWSGEGVGYRRAALIGRLKYDYAAKYMAEANIRYDGSDYFPSGKRWGAFFSGSVAWAASEEKFWSDWGLKKIFDQFKLRASYGEIGQDFLDLNGDYVADRFAYVSSYTLYTRGAFLGEKWYPSFSEGALISPDMTWYTTKDFNLGIDFSSLNSRLSGSLDYFAKVTTGYLATPSNVGYTSPLGKTLPVVKSNGESIRRGFEFVLQWKDHIGDFNYGVSANMTYYDDRWNVNPNEAETGVKNPYKRGTQVGAYTGIYYKNLTKKLVDLTFC
jgi:TonB-linked SusC/RagA family outer membrane protein